MPTIGSILGEAFGLLRTRAAAIAVWAALYFAVSFGMGLAMRPLMEAQAAQFQPLRPRMDAGAQPSPLAAFATIGPIFLLSQIVVIAVMLALYAAAFRAILFPDRSRAFYLRLGMDELRLLGLMVVLVIGTTILWFVGGLAFTVLIAALAAVIGSTGGGAAFAGVFLLAMLLLFPLMGAFIFVWTRLSLAGPLTLLRRRITIGEAWRLSKGHFWTLFGVYLLLTILFLVVFLIVFAALGGSTFLAMMQARGNPAEIQQIAAVQQGAPFGVLGIAGGVVMALLGAIAVALFAGAMAAAARQLLPTATDDVFA